MIDDLSLINVDAAILVLTRGFCVAAFSDAHRDPFERGRILILLGHWGLLRRGVEFRALSTYTNHCESPETWWSWSVTIRLPRACKTRALPIELQPHIKSCPEYNGGTL